MKVYEERQVKEIASIKWCGGDLVLSGGSTHLDTKDLMEILRLYTALSEKRDSNEDI